MRNLLLSLFFAALVAAVCIDASPARNADVLHYLPDESDLAGWTALGDPQVAGGDDLYLLIDGAAELYMEYGFEMAVFQSYGNESEKSINLEIYKMADTSAAFGMYTFRTSERGEAVAIGGGASIEDYYLNFWKGSFFVTVIGFDTNEETTEGITAIAEAVAVRIEEGGQMPRLTGVLPADGLTGVKYLRGNLALYNNYEFDRANIFGLSEGVIGMYGDHRIFLFLYKDEAESRKWFLNGIKSLESSPDFHALAQHGNGYSMRDKNGDHLRIEIRRNYIIVVLGTEENANNLMLKQRARIDQSE